MEAVIRLRNVVKIYKSDSIRFRALQGVSLDIYPGEFLALIGKSGSGKSTLLHLMAGLDDVTAGQILVSGRPIHRMDEKARVRFRKEQVGYVFQNFCLMEKMTALENIMFPLMIRGCPKKVREKKARALLSSFGLLEHQSHYPGQLSGGQQQRVAIARAIVDSPPILFADEPTGNLDSAASEEIVQVLRDICKKNKTTLVMVTHDMEKAACADRIVMIKDGQIKKEEV